MMNVKNKLKSNAGFSLVELMVVIAIIGILTTIAVPSLSRFQESARKVQAKTELSSMYTLYTATHLTVNDYTNMDLFDVGFKLSGTQPERYYASGVSGTEVTWASGIVDGDTFVPRGDNKCAAANAPVGARGAATFTLQSTGCPLDSSTLNTWSIDQDRALTET
jgi:prepilin-type N-terminal cleavage/methylation domain-containing protein